MNHCCICCTFRRILVQGEVIWSDEVKPIHIHPQNCEANIEYTWIYIYIYIFWDLGWTRSYKCRESAYAAKNESHSWKEPNSHEVGGTRTRRGLCDHAVSRTASFAAFPLSFAFLWDRQILRFLLSTVYGLSWVQFRMRIVRNKEMWEDVRICEISVIWEVSFYWTTEQLTDVKECFVIVYDLGEFPMSFPCHVCHVLPPALSKTHRSLWAFRPLPRLSQTKDPAWRLGRGPWLAIPQRWEISENLKHNKKCGNELQPHRHSLPDYAMPCMICMRYAKVLNFEAEPKFQSMHVGIKKLSYIPFLRCTLEAAKTRPRLRELRQAPGSQRGCQSFHRNWVDLC